MTRMPRLIAKSEFSAAFKTASGADLDLRVVGRALHGSMDLGGGDSSTIWNGDRKLAAAEAAEFIQLMKTIEAGSDARFRLAELAGEFERDILARDAEFDGED